MKIVTIVGKAEDFDLSKYEVDKVKLDHHEMNKSHQKVVSEKGTVIGISLDSKQVLSHGSVLYKDDDRIILVEGKDEDVFVIEPKGEMEWGMTCFNLGNLHCMVYFDNNLILVPYDPVLERTIKKLHVNFKHERRMLSGVRASLHQHHEH